MVQYSCFSQLVWRFAESLHEAKPCLCSSHLLLVSQALESVLMEGRRDVQEVKMLLAFTGIARRVLLPAEPVPGVV